LLVLLGAVVLMLLIACANVAGLLLARGAERGAELAVRSALGATHGRLVRQLLTESLLLATLGGALGLALAAWGTDLLVGLSPPGLPRVDTIAIDGRVLAFALAVTFGSVLVFGLIPALRFSRPELLPALGSGGRTTSSRARARLRSGLVVTEIALALVLLVGAGLLIRSFSELIANRVGFATERRVAVQLFLWDSNPSVEKRLQRMDQITTRFREIPGVDQVGLVSALPFHPSQIAAQGQLRVEGRATPAGEMEAQVHTTIASREYFRVMAVPLERGRNFEPRDRMDAPRVALVNETLARRVFPGEDPVGKRVTVGVMAAPETREIVGIVGDVRPTTLDSDPRAELFIPFSQSGNGSVTFVVSTHGDPGALVPLLREKVWEIDPTQTVYHAATVKSLISDTLMERRFHLVLLVVFSLIALILAAIGVYGLISVTTRQRTHEIGVRIAMGARPRDVVGLIASQGMRLIVPGVLIGAAGALLLTRFLENMLYRVKPTDATTFTQVAAIMILVAMIGVLVPALRAAVTNPIQALREE
jgi:putative ABC transport system permease protein